MNPVATSLPFTRVLVRSDAGLREFSTTEFLAQELYLRVRWLLGGQVEFFAGDKELDRNVALAALRQSVRFS